MLHRIILGNFMFHAVYYVCLNGRFSLLNVSLIILVGIHFVEGSVKNTGRETRCSLILCEKWYLFQVQPLPVLEEILWAKGMDDVTIYRIPIMSYTPNGNLVAAVEARKSSGGDAGPKFLAVRRSTDGGRVVNFIWALGFFFFLYTWIYWSPTSSCL